MTILEALCSLNTFPVPDTIVEIICIDRELSYTEDYTKIIGESEEYQLAAADVYYWLATHPDITEQEVGIKQSVEIRKNFLAIANRIYNEFNDPKYSGTRYGFIGEAYNG